MEVLIALRNNSIAMFNALMIRNKRNLIASIETYIEQLRAADTSSVKYPSRHQLIIDIFQQFLANIKNMELPVLTKPLTCYEYYLRHDGISLEISHYEYIIFNENNDIEESIASSREIYHLPCELKTVAEYAELYGVTVITVRQWIRRGKLRTAKKNGRDWLIPSLSVPPQRGYVSARYYWEHLSETVSSHYPFLPSAGSLYMYQSTDNKQLYTALITDKADNSYQELQFDSKDRERLELALISESTVNIDIDTEYEILPIPQNSSTLPILATNGDLDLDIQPMAKPIYDESFAFFDCKSSVGDSYYDGDADNYVIPIYWELYDQNLTEENRKIGTVSGHLILTDQIIQDGYDVVAICDDISEDLRYVMSALSGTSGPLYQYDVSSGENVLYIHEIKMEPAYETPELIGRLIRELPWLCMRFMHVRPDIIAYFISELVTTNEQKALAASYMQSGFVHIGESNVIYAYTE